MKKRKGTLPIGCVAVCVLLMISGCGKDATANQERPDDNYAEIETEIEVVESDSTKSVNQVMTIEDAEVPLAAVPKRLDQAEELGQLEEIPAPTVEMELSLTEEEPLTVEIAVEKPKPFDTKALSEGVINRINEIRTAQGIGNLTVTTELLNAASTRASELSQSFSHERPDGRDNVTALDDAGVVYGATGENLFYGYSSVQEIENAWSSSSIHSENVMNANYKHIGVGCVETGKGIFLVQIFTD